ncbi:TraI/MobA(P) family conjugative relaxase [Desulforhopalus singaporensis]|uniref:Relaxase/Mobilisation nuclease domain-containing protein n=1 Tax=Desulforhopalus singaporensis TaxID=91360 RepID=A0A1H0PAP9_9BACT|nr:TraI/MobA(P) family conjugative relaxase [Desulforhopalus singaporensis]SDP01758.1 Relaxase/Mobilisation nuclease domain-containing protein [Desulforhopalus singaporensis]
MISKRIHCKPKNDNYRRLALYIADASHKGEKCLQTWTAGCYAGQDYHLAIDEIKTTQKLNTRSQKEKTYHLIISFHPEDMQKLSGDDFHQIEKEFANALGFENHQRLCGVHINTDNPHMHVAYNMIDKEKFTRHDPFYDYHKRDKLCRELEKKYGLTADPGVEQQFTDYLEQKKSYITEALQSGSSWDELHRQLAGHGLVIQKRGNGLVIGAIGHKQSAGFHVRMSSLGKDFSRKKLENRRGTFVKTSGDHAIIEYFRRIPKNSKASDFQAKSGMKSFESYIRQNLESVKQAAAIATTWEDFHRDLAALGMEIKPRGAGYVLQDLGSKVRVPFSTTGLRIAQLKKKLGEFELSRGTYKPEKRYKPTRIRSGVSRKSYLPTRKKRKNTINKISGHLEDFFADDYDS